MKELLGRDAIKPTSTDGSSYESHCQPLTGQLLRALEMNLVYTNGDGQWLFTEIAGQPRRVLDITGGYGANLLGHKNQRILEIAQNYLQHGEPSLVQGSARASSGELARKISDILQAETGEGPWVTTLSNSGTEAIEAALKHCLIAFAKKQQERLQDLRKGMNEIRLFVQELDSNETAALIKDWRYRLTLLCADIKASDSRKDWLLHMVMQTHTMPGLLDLIETFNLSQLGEEPIFAALERAYHGKTMGALHLTHNDKYREPFYVDNAKTKFIPPHADDESLTKFFTDSRLDYIEIGIHQIGIFFGKQSFSQIAGIFVEPIQGEAGVFPLEANFLALLKKHSLQESIPLVFDEIQSGTYRTGLMAAGHHSHITADIYCFSKALGGGLAKIGATSIHHRRYQDDFGYLHASTFAEDGYSAAIGCEVLNILSDSSFQDNVAARAEILKSRLTALAEEFPDVLVDVRGKGLMLAIEFSPSLREICFEFNVFAEANMLGYLIASAMLHRENIRMSPSLSNGATLRVQPSAFITTNEIEFFTSGLRSVLLRLQDGDFGYFFQHLYADTPLARIPAEVLSTRFEKSERPLAVFLCHLIDGSHVKRVSPAFIPVKDSDLEARLGLMKRAMEFGIYHAQPLKDAQGNTIDVILMGIPMTSADLKKSFMGRGRSDIVAKVQRAVDMAHELGANTVGLGQFTSIVSGNGLYLDSHGMNLTTGNSYTIALAVEAALRDAQNKNINLDDSAVGLVGAAGNIVSVAAMLMADKAKKLVLIHHSPLEKSPKLVGVVRTILNESLKSEAESKFNLALQERLSTKILQDDKALVSWLSDSTNHDLIRVTDDLNALTECAVIITGASSGQGFLQPQHFAKDAVVVDVAVPANIKPEMLERLKNERKDVSYYLGGVAKIPQDQSIVTAIFPLETNESFACMAETFAMGFSDAKGLMHTGNLTKQMVQRSIDLAKAAGFELGTAKTKNSL